MRTLFILPLLASVLGVTGCARTPAQTAASNQRQAADADRLATALAGLVPDAKSTTCLPLTGTRQSQVQAFGPTLLYRYSRGLVYRSDTAGGCERVARGDVLVTRQTSQQLCAGDIATTVDVVARFQTGSCSFGPFTAYRKP